jgi:hypothetical protein
MLGLFSNIDYDTSIESSLATVNTVSRDKFDQSKTRKRFN